MTTAKILIRGVNRLGDAVMSMPAVCRLREAWPDAHIALLSPVGLADLWRDHPALDAVLAFTPGDAPRRIALRLRAEAFDTGLIFPNSFRSAWEMWLARVPRRIGYAGHDRSWMLTHALSRPPEAVPMRKPSPARIERLIYVETAPRAPLLPPTSHHIHHYLTLTAAVEASPQPLRPKITITEGNVRNAARRHGLDLTPPAPPLFGLAPGAGYGGAKCWPEERYIAAAAEIQRRTGCRWVLVGDDADVGLAGRVAAGIQAEYDRRGSAQRFGETCEGHKAVWNLAGETTVRDLCALLKACRLLVTNDTGPMHVAAAVGTPVVGIFGSTSPALTGPGLPGSRGHTILSPPQPCSPCFLRECPIDSRCLKATQVEDVVRAALSLWHRK